MIALLWKNGPVSAASTRTGELNEPLPRPPDGEVPVVPKPPSGGLGWGGVTRSAGCDGSDSTLVLKLAFCPGKKKSLAPALR